MRNELPLIGRLIAERRAQRAEEKFRTAIAAAREAGDKAKEEDLRIQRRFEDELEHDEHEVAYTNALRRDAHFLRVPLPPRPPYSFDREDNEHWHWSSYLGEYYLSPVGYSVLREDIRREREARRNERNHWLQWVAGLTGLIGAISGLVAVLNSAG